MKAIVTVLLTLVLNSTSFSSTPSAPERVVPGHDTLIFKRFPTKGRVAKIK